MKMKIVLVLILVVFGATALVVNAQRGRRSADGVEWQKSKSTSVTLGIRDKHNTLCADQNYNCSYIVTAVVTGPDRKKYRLEKRTEGGAFCYFLFPEDFKAYPEASGVYTVDYVVRGKVVVQDAFRWSYPYENLRRAHR